MLIILTWKENINNRLMAIESRLDAMAETMNK